jgi:uncharacterized protein (TIRG00374 family)
LALRTVPVDKLASALSQANYLWLAPTLLLQFLSTLLRAERWRVLLNRRVTLVESFWAYSVGFVFTNIFPFRLGEPARIAVLAGQRRLPVVEVAATVGVERLLDIISVVVILLAVLPFMSIPSEVIQAEILFGAGAITGLSVIFILVKSSDQSEAFLRRQLGAILPTYADAIMARWVELVRGAAVLTHRSIGLQAIGWSIAAWLCSIGIQWTIMRAFQPTAGLLEAAFMVAALALAIAVPAGPGFIGVYQWIGQQSLVRPFPQLYTASIALGIAITAHLAYYLFTTGLGLIGLWYFGQSFIGLRHRLNRPPGEVKAIPEI